MLDGGDGASAFVTSRGIFALVSAGCSKSKSKSKSKTNVWHRPSLVAANKDTGLKISTTTGRQVTGSTYVLICWALNKDHAGLVTRKLAEDGTKDDKTSKRGWPRWRPGAFAQNLSNTFRRLSDVTSS